MSFMARTRGRSKTPTPVSADTSAGAPTSRLPVLTARGVTHGYRDLPVLTDVDLTVVDGEILGVVGPNGSGKTTLLRVLSGAERPTGGTVHVGEQNVHAMNPRDLARQMAVVVQEPPGEMLLTVGETVLLGRSPHVGAFHTFSREDEAIALAALDRLGVGHLMHRNLAEVSGGERQRIMIARALAQQPSCLLLDEPTNHLDVHFQHRVLQLVRESGLTGVVVLHDLNLAARFCDRLLILDHGSVLAHGRPEDVLTRPTLEPVYGVRMEPVTGDDGVGQLLFRLHDPEHTTGSQGR